MSKKGKIRIFLVDDDPMYLKSLENELTENSSLEIKTFPTGEAVISALHEKPDVIFLDYYLNSVDAKAMNGLQTLKKIKSTHSEQAVVMLTSQDRIEVAVNCMRNEAFDYIVKSEASAMRANNAIKNLFKYRALEKDARFYKITGLTTFAVVSLLILLFIIMSIFFPDALRMYFSNPGWI